MYLFIYSETLRLGSLPSKLSAPHSRVSIIPPDQIVAIDAMATEQFTIAQITEQFDMGAEAVAEQKNSALKWLAKYGLIANTMTCSNDKVLQFCARWGLIANSKNCNAPCAQPMSFIKNANQAEGYCT